MKFLFDLFPIILFFVAFKIWGIFTATACEGMALMVFSLGSLGSLG